MGNISNCYCCGKEFNYWAEKKAHLAKIPECKPKQEEKCEPIPSPSPTPPRLTRSQVFLAIAFILSESK